MSMTGTRLHLIGTLLIQHRDEIDPDLAEQVRKALPTMSNEQAEDIISALTGKAKVTGI
jgi:hypothetical protein